MRILSFFLLLLFLPVSVSALELDAPPVPEGGRQWLPSETDSLWDGLAELLQKAAQALHPDIQEASRVCLGILAAVLLVSMLQAFTGMTKKMAEASGAVAIASMLLRSANSMILLGTNTVREMAAYGKLLIPVMTTALAAQGGITTSAALYAGTALFTALLQGVMDSLLVPGIYLYLALSTGSCVAGENMLKRAAALLKNILNWILKILLIVFTTYLSLTRVVSGTADAAALKATKVGMSSLIPVVGGILSDASEAVLVSAGLLKNSAGIYGILAVMSLFLYPFLQIWVHYIMLKLTEGISALFPATRLTGIVEAFSSAMGILLAITGAECVMVLISTVCFMKGVG